MYGLLIEAILDNIRKRFGDETLAMVCDRAGVRNLCFSTHDTYSEQLIPNIAQAAAEITGIPEDELMDAFGVTFVSFVGQYGYDSILKVLGRHMRDFLNGLDNLHEYLRFSYPKLRPPSFFVENESKNGLTLHYRTRRKGFLHYVKGQIRQVGELFYNTKVDIFVIDQYFNPEDNTTHVTFRLLFDNIAYKEATRINEDSIFDNIPLRSELLFELFPFHVVFGRAMVIRSVGSALAAVIPDCIGLKLTEVFFLARPIMVFSWEHIMAHTNNVFEIISSRFVKKVAKDTARTTSTVVVTEKNITERTEENEYDEKHKDIERKKNQNSASDSENEITGEAREIDEKDSDDDTYRLHVKGQMMYMSEWDSIIFLGTPIMKSLDDMFNSGLYINDLSMHDSSRDLVLAGTQQSAELKLALDQEQEKSRLLEESMKKLDAEMQRTDALLYQMIPKPVADRLRRGEPSVSTCEVFESVTILFSDVVGFTTICSRITPMEVVSMLNAMYTEFDKLSEKHNVYKVETIGDAYMAVAGAPTTSRFHALSMCNMALDMLLAMEHLRDPSTQDNMKIRVGIHTGNTVAGVVGIKMPRYCLFGDTVNTASRMETNGEALKIHISETTREELREYPYRVEYRGAIEVKGKGSMKTYWLLGQDDSPSKMPRCPLQQLIELERQQKERESRGTDSLTLDILHHRPVYSPVSFDDIHSESSSRHSPVPSSYSSPSHGTGLVAGGRMLETICRTKVSNCVQNLSGDVKPISPPATGIGAASQQAMTSSLSSFTTANAKPMQAVTPQLTKGHNGVKLLPSTFSSTRDSPNPCLKQHNSNIMKNEASHGLKCQEKCTQGKELQSNVRPEEGKRKSSCTNVNSLVRSSVWLPSDLHSHDQKQELSEKPRSKTCTFL